MILILDKHSDVKWNFKGVEEHEENSDHFSEEVEDFIQIASHDSKAYKVA